MKGISSFEDLVVFQKAYKLSLQIHKMSLQMPQNEQYGLASQIRNTSKSVCANLAEGFGKQSISKAEFRRFISMSMGSADEMRVWLRYCLDLGYITEVQWTELRSGYQDVAKMLNGLYRSWE
jgi:four helix bundle protein